MARRPGTLWATALPFPGLRMPRSRCGTVPVSYTHLDVYKRQRQECVRADVVDALGAGDAFIAAFLAEYHAGGGDLADAAQKASVFAAQCCGHYGAFGRAMPYPAKCAGEKRKETCKSP